MEMLFCKILEKPEEHQKYLDIARNMAQQWATGAFETDHYRLAFDQPNTWSLKYNLVWDELFGLHLFSPQVTSLEVAYYLKQQNRYGVPNESPNRVPFADWYWTTDGRQRGFQNRSVVGGHFIKLLQKQWIAEEKTIA